MTYIQHYDSPLGGILLAADEIGLTGLWFDGQKCFARDLSGERVDQETPALTEARRWLDIYFTGKEPDFLPPLHPTGSNSARPYGKSFCRFPMGKPRPTVKSPGSLPKSRDLPGCPRRRWAARSDITKSPSSSPATGWSAQTAV